MERSRNNQDKNSHSYLYFHAVTLQLQHCMLPILLLRCVPQATTAFRIIVYYRYSYSVELKVSEQLNACYAARLANCNKH